MQIDKLQRAVEDALAVIPCYGKDWYSSRGFHDWINVYNRGTMTPKGFNIANTPNSVPSTMMPYQMCRHCHKRSNDLS